MVKGQRKEVYYMAQTSMGSIGKIALQFILS
jgi:hypothetical protein